MSANYGWIDTSVFIHALFKGDEYRATCRKVQQDLKSGQGHGKLIVLVIHELTYALQRVVRDKFTKPRDVCDFLIPFLNLPSLEIENKEAVIAALLIWDNSEDKTSFVDAYISSLALQEGNNVCTVNSKDFPSMKNTLPHID